ncbi:hypothetical protein FBD94_19530 [Pedobacter hiemivivus]|uniref:Uncharacterized protein n=1 Tax=Pedobacter hiemivivus TaxID=2530454 RepID=A0A4U1GAN6_9SPHI|nr:hypothetical protein [Pedobacter hiemivivus]TKC58142.1 hypothetical protein FBD94_19530 [Pedobacter hiemivivus]
MGKLDGKFIRGAVGDITFKKVGKKQYVQKKSKMTVKDQTEATKKSAQVFGQASSLASSIRVSLDSIIGFYDTFMVSRFTGDTGYVLNTALVAETQKFVFNPNSFNRFNGFEFNLNSPVKNYLFAQPEVTTSGNTLELTLPEMNIPQDLRFPQPGRNCIIALQIAQFDLKHGYHMESNIQSAEINYAYKPAIIPASKFTFEIAPGCLCIIGIALKYYEKTFAGNDTVNNKTFNPSAILKAFMTEGEPNMEITGAWLEMDFKNQPNP